MRINSLKKKKGADIVVANSDFARILEVSPARGLFSYEFSFTVDQLKAIKHNLSSVQILIRRAPKPRDTSIFTIGQKEQAIKPSLAIANLITGASTKKDLKLANLTSPIQSVFASVKPKISTQLARRVKLAESEDEAESLLPTQKTIVSKLVSALNAQNLTAPIMKTAVNVASNQGITAPAQPINANIGTIQAASLSLILNKKIDPSAVAGINTKIISTQHAFAGTISSTNKLTTTTPKSSAVSAKLLSPLAALISKPSNPTSGVNVLADVEIPVIEVVSQRFVEVTRAVDINQDELKGIDKFIVEMKLISDNDKVISSITKSVSHRRLLDIFNTPRAAPRVQAAPVQLPGRNVIELTQLDKNATIIKMYRKTITRVTNVNDPAQMAYAYSGEFNITKADGTIKIVDRINNSSTIVYRFIAVGPGGAVGAEFTNVIIPGTGLGINRRRKSIVSAAIDVVPEGDAARIRLTNIVRGPVSLALQRRNRTTHESDFSFVGQPRSVVLLNSDDDIEFLDNGVKPDNIYEYRCLIYFECGSEELSSANFLYEHPGQDDDGVDIITSDPLVEKIAISNNSSNSKANVLQTGFNVRFSIRSELDETGLEQVKKILQRQGISGLFAQELLEDKQELSRLVAHAVRRFNTATGELEDYGVISGRDFSDIIDGKTRAVRPLRPGITYRYMISTLIRSAETMFKSSVKTKISPTRLTGTSAHPSNLTTQQYALRPSKFLHPLTLKTGTLTTAASRNTKHAREEFMYGNIGNTSVVEITIPAENTDIIRTRVQRADKVTNIITWDVIGDTARVDYFMITLNHLGTEQVIGQVHALSDATTFEFIHELDDVDVGNAQYTITAMLTTFERGPTVDTDRFCI